MATPSCHHLYYRTGHMVVSSLCGNLKKNMHRQQLLAAKYTEKKNVVSKQKLKP